MAEEIWFNYVWEEKKDASNVIDYNINSEQTKDLFAEINANNQTTTGMATVIPWINAPKLRAATSIVGWAGGWAIQYAEIALSYNGTITQNNYENFDDMTITWDSFVSIDPNYSNRILIEPWVYFAYVYIDAWNVYRTFDTSMRYFYSWMVVWPEIIDVINSTEMMSISTIFEVTTTWWCLRIWVRPTNWNINSFNNDVLKLMKMR